ncbi:MAG: E3 binding domain-containing protein, partial [Anaerolineae bacterium]|nr:E3 binding domain-containing protein [Anaerolineae bacterium]
MAVEIVMPRLGWTMEEGTLVEWIKQDGDPVEPGDILFVVESDKALNEVEAFDAGIFRIPPDSDVVGKLLPVGTLLAYIVQPGEEPPFEKAASASPTTAASASVPVEPAPVSAAPSNAPAPNGERSNGLPTISPRARRVAGELGVDWMTLTGSGRTGRIVERDVRAAAQTRPAAARVSPVARRAADDLGVDVAALAAQLPGQRITREAVERAAALTPADETRTPIPRVRQVIAERMAASAHTTAAVTLTTGVDATHLVKVRPSLKAAAQNDARPVPTYNDLLAKLVA